MRRLNIYYQCDDNWAFFMGTSITSLLENASTEIQYNIYIATTDLSDSNRNKFHVLLKSYPHIHCKIIYMDAAKVEGEIRTWNLPTHRYRNVTYYKLLIDWFFKDIDVDRVIEIGPDTLVMGDLSELIDFDFCGNPIAMNWSEKIYNRRFKRSYKYCIAEMVFFDLEEWRKHHCEERLVNRIKKYGDIVGSKDEGLLNLEFQHEMAQLPLKYNIYGITVNFSWKNKLFFNAAPVVSRQEIRKAYEHPEIIHIPGTFLYRPYEIGSEHPLKELWWDYCKKSPWKDLSPMQPAALGVKEKIIRWIYLHAEKEMAEIIFILFRRGYGLAMSFLYPYRKSYSKKIKQIYNE